MKALLAAVVLCSCRGHVAQDQPKDVVEPMQQTDDMQAIRNDRIQFATMRPPRATTPTLERQVVLTGPPEAMALAERGDVAILDALIGLLAERDRAWAAEVMLAALTGREADIVNSFASQPDAFFDGVGQTAKDRWRTWLDGARAKLEWDASRKQFVSK